MLSLNEKIDIIVGNRDLAVNKNPLIPFENIICLFLAELSTTILADTRSSKYPDVVTFAFWCRKSNIAKLQQQFADPNVRLGLGYVFHIAPSNVPINFAFSLVFSLLAGNSNIVRVPSKNFEQVDIICDAINHLFRNKIYQDITERIIIIRFPQDDAIAEKLSMDCNARIIWGGDQTIRHIKKIPLPVRSREIAFADRYSFCILDSQRIIDLGTKELKSLVNGFYNDTYLMDQNACSSPHLIIWLGDDDNVSNAQERFWSALNGLVVTKYDLQAIHAVDKYTMMCHSAINLEQTHYFSSYENYIYRLKLDELPDSVDNWRGKYGLFYEYTTQDINTVSSIVNNKYQTLTYFGVNKKILEGFVLTNNLNGIDRIVPVGKALDMSLIWDGYDLIRTLSRICDIY
ncbi:acyl-CoA reductase [Paenibacillus sp. GXUN7292]|uniref:acyl-CoA reductase n=1 Tax=Paenibacillus sp. GXUN7292 TaxID=3422499 RepID=UPI003D7DDE52